MPLKSRMHRIFDSNRECTGLEQTRNNWINLRRRESSRPSTRSKAHHFDELVRAPSENRAKVRYIVIIVVLSLQFELKAILSDWMIG